MSFIAIKVVTTGVEQSCIYWHSEKMGGRVRGGGKSGGTGTE